MASWQIKGLLLLASALVATALAASTSGAGSRSSLHLATVRPAADAAAAPEPAMDATVIGRSPRLKQG